MAASWSVSRFVTVAMGIVIGLTFLFGFGNVLGLALKLGVPALVAPLIAPAVDLTVLGLLVGTRHLALSGAGEEVLRPARRLLLAASVVTLLLNVADPVCSGQWGKAAFDSVGPLLLIGWAETGPGLLRALNSVSTEIDSAHSCLMPVAGPMAESTSSAEQTVQQNSVVGETERIDSTINAAGELLERARCADTEHWRKYRRPISAETLRKQLRIGASRSRALVAVLRAESSSVGATDIEPRLT